MVMTCTASPQARVAEVVSCIAFKYFFFLHAMGSPSHAMHAYSTNDGCLNELAGNFQQWLACWYYCWYVPLDTPQSLPSTVVGNMPFSATERMFGQRVCAYL
jgi:hypothetical protein